MGTRRRALLFAVTTLLVLPGVALTAPLSSAAAPAITPVCTSTVPCFPVSSATNLGPAGGEPSIQDDGAGHIYITTPLGTGSIGGTGVRFSRSSDGGATWVRTKDASNVEHPYTDIGGPVGGSDSDVLVDSTRKNLYVADLAAAFSNILRSQDGGKTFPVDTQTAFEDDREWVTTVGPNVYVTFHDFAGNLPLIYGSTDQGVTFAPFGFANTGQIFAPSDAGFADTKCNTLVGKPVTDAAGTIYILTNTSTAAEDLAATCSLPAPLDRFYLSVSKDGGHTFTSHLVSDLSMAGNPGQLKSGSWGHVFNQLAIDAAGNLYIDASATLDGVAPLQNYLLVSQDHGVTFSKPIATNPQPLHGQLFPAIAAGQAGQVAVGYYQGLFADHHKTGSNFQFIIDETLNALAPGGPTFTHTQLAPLKGTTPQPDGICTDGIFCGTPASSGGNRNLADFESMTTDETGHLEVILPADSDGSNTENWFYKQTTGPLIPPGATNGNGTGNQTWVAGARTTAPPPPVAAAASPSPTPSVLPNTSGTPANPTRLGPIVLVLVAVLLVGPAVFLRQARRKRRPLSS